MDFFDCLVLNPFRYKNVVWNKPDLKTRNDKPKAYGKLAHQRLVFRYLTDLTRNLSYFGHILKVEQFLDRLLPETVKRESFIGVYKNKLMSDGKILASPH